MGHNFHVIYKPCELNCNGTFVYQMSNIGCGCCTERRQYSKEELLKLIDKEIEFLHNLKKEIMEFVPHHRKYCDTDEEEGED